ncbi:MAG: hypothetical protein QOI90_4398 [Mycobacterium sp.]|nr:hypothetical protein [Mycobacterium sp.]
MSMLLERLLMWIADAFDRSLLTVPEVGDELATGVGRLRPERVAQPINENRFGKTTSETTVGPRALKPRHRLPGVQR